VPTFLAFHDIPLPEQVCPLQTVHQTWVGSLRPRSRPKVGKVDWQVLDQLPAIHGIQFICDAMTAAGRGHPVSLALQSGRCQNVVAANGSLLDFLRIHPPGHQPSLAERGGMHYWAASVGQ
jgi:hypothetical protein